MATTTKHPLTRRGLVAIVTALTVGSVLALAGAAPLVPASAGAATAQAPVCTAHAAAKGCVPATPTGLAATRVSATGATLTWSPVPGATGYNLFVGGTMVKGTAAPPMTDTSRAPGSTVDYTVSAHDAAGRSTQTAPLTVTTLPATPRGLVATAGDGQVTLGWSAAAGASGYTVLSGGTPVTTTTATSVVVGGLDDGTTYTLSVEATDSSGPSAPAAAVAATPMPPLPGAPADVTASTITAAGATLGWDPVSRATDYVVTVGDVVLGTTTGTTWTDTSAAPGTTVPYSVAAVDASGAGTATTVDVETLPAAPSGPTASDPTASGATVTWQPVAGATGYVVAADGTTLGTTTATTWTDTTAASGSAVVYTVTASDTSGPGAPSTPVTVTTLPAAPTGVTPSAVTASGATVSWDGVPGATGYLVYVQDIVIATTSATTWTDTTAAAGTTVPYSVAATDASGSGAPSTPVTVTTLPAAPAGLAASAVTASGATLTWQPTTGATAYVVSAGGTTLGTTTSTGWTDSTAPSGSPVDYTVAATDASGSGAPSTPVTVTTLPAAPVGLAASAVTASGATLTWQPTTGATAYVVSAGGTTLGTTTSTGWTDSTAPSGSAVDYTVAATDASGSGAAAAADVVTLPAAPTEPTASAVTASGATLTWAAVPGATGYLVYAQDILVAGTTAPTYADASSPSGSAVSYVVVATDASGAGQPSTAVAVTTLPAAPDGLSASAVGATGATLTWSPVAGATGYTASVDGTPFEATSRTAATDTGEAPGATLQYTVTAQDATGGSVPSAPVQVVLAPAAPVGVAAYPAAGALSVRWPAVPGATSYAVRSPESHRSWSPAPRRRWPDSPTGPPTRPP